ncbi:uncharacterized protein VTP21DRAFT_9702, partial [Calcarisporiella thermophila]|uniref:uncharacterized protein n=1 Tax=Calcarisporiella thermophila TaxID=911321 RepID=UPI0037428366
MTNSETEFQSSLMSTFRLKRVDVNCSKCGALDSLDINADGHGNKYFRCNKGCKESTHRYVMAHILGIPIPENARIVKSVAKAIKAVPKEYLQAHRPPATAHARTLDASISSSDNTPAPTTSHAEIATAEASSPPSTPISASSPGMLAESDSEEEETGVERINDSSQPSSKRKAIAVESSPEPTGSSTWKQVESKRAKLIEKLAEENSSLSRQNAALQSQLQILAERMEHMAR